MDLNKIQNDFKLNKKEDGLDLFFGKKTNINNFGVIDPIKDEKINKLQSSVDNLRKALQNDTLPNDKETLLKKRVENTKKKLAAIKIQIWFRKIMRQRSTKQLNEMEKYVVKIWILFLN